MIYYQWDNSVSNYLYNNNKEESRMETVVKIEQSDAISNFVQLADSTGWDMSHDECVAWMKVAVAGITDCLNQFKSKENRLRMCSVY